MKKLYPLLSVLFLIYWGCEEEVVEDTTPPTVTVTFPQNSSTVYEIVIITCTSSDNEGVAKVELLVNGAPTGLIDESEPYSFNWNTTTLEDGAYTITIRSYDTSDNTTDSESVVLTVDNTQSNPQPVNITSIIFENGGFTVSWNQSTDGDFSSYELERSTDTTMNNSSIVFTTDSLEQTNYFDTDIDPLIYQYYRVTISDTFDYETKGDIYSSSLDPVPTSVNVTSVTYTLEEMTVTFEESQDNDFRDYKLLHSETETGDKDTLDTSTEKETTSFTITDFNPTHENWFWVLVTDNLGQSALGTGLSNEINGYPEEVNIFEITYDLSGMAITWEKSDDWDFASYELNYSNIAANDSTILFTGYSVNDTSFSMTEFDPSIEQWYWITVTDYWGQTSQGNDYLILDDTPTVSELYDIEFNDFSFFITWSQNTDEDFQSFALYESNYYNMDSAAVIYTTTDPMDTSFIVSNLDYNDRRYYQVRTADIWNLESVSDVEEGYSPGIMFTKSFSGTFGQDVISTNDGGYIIAGEQNEDLLLIKTDEFGNEQWTQNFGEDGREDVREIIQTDDDGYAIFGTYQWIDSSGLDNYLYMLIKFSAGGTEEWRQYYGDDSTYISSAFYSYGESFVQTSDGGFILAGWSNTFEDGNAPYLVKVDTEGNEQWHQYYGDHWGLTINKIKPSNEGGYVLVCNTAAGGDRNIYVIKIGPYGEEEWISERLGWWGDNNQAFDIVQNSEGNYIIGGFRFRATNSSSNYGVLFYIDSDGNEINHYSNGLQIYSVDIYPDDKSLVVGMHEDPSTDSREIIVWKTQSVSGAGGSWGYSPDFGNEYGEYGRSGKVTDDGGCIVVGDGGGNIYLIKLDSEGNTLSNE